MSKLKNIKALNEMLSGNHRTQTRKTHGFSDTKYQTERSKVREVGEVWEEIGADGKTICWWKQEQGYRVKYNVHPDISKSMDAVREYLRSFPNCQKETCTCTSPTNLDKKFRAIMGMCEDCTISMETRLKIEGKFNEYALNKMKANAEAFFKQSDVEVEILKSQFKNMGIVDSEFGDVEKWTLEDLDGMLEKIDNSYNDFKTKTLGKLEA